MDELERKAKHCMTHHHACDCREWHHQQQLNICDRRIEAHTSYINELEAELASVKEIVRKMGSIFEFALEEGHLGCERIGNADCDCGPCQLFRLSQKILNLTEVKAIMKEGV